MVSVLEIVTIRSCKGVAIRKVKTMLAIPTDFKTNSVCLWGILRAVCIKKIPYPIEWNTIPINAQILDGLSEPFRALGKNKLLKKFFDQVNPTEFLSRIDPPG